MAPILASAARLFMALNCAALTSVSVVVHRRSAKLMGGGVALEELCDLLLSAMSANWARLYWATMLLAKSTSNDGSGFSGVMTPVERLNASLSNDELDGIGEVFWDTCESSFSAGVSGFLMVPKVSLMLLSNLSSSVSKAMPMEMSSLGVLLFSEDKRVPTTW